MNDERPLGWLCAWCGGVWPQVHRVEDPHGETHRVCPKCVRTRAGSEWWFAHGFVDLGEEQL